MQNVIDFKDNAITYGYLLIDGELRFGKGRSYGAEFLIRKNVGKFTGWISYTYSRSFRTIKGIDHGHEYRSPYDRPHNLVIVANYDLTPRISLAANWIYNTGQPVTFPYGQYTINGMTYAVYNGILEEGHTPRSEDDKDERPAGVDLHLGKLKVAVPGEGHEDIADDEQQYGD